MSGPQHRSGGQSRPTKCYNCGALDHFLTTCPEPTRDFPAGLVAAHAARSRPQSHEHGDGRPNKRQKVEYNGQVVTRYPAPSSGPVVTRYAPPPNAVPAQGAQGYYGPQSSVPYQQSQSYPNQQYGPPIALQPQVGYPPYSQQPPYGHPPTGAPQYGQAQYVSSHGYGDPAPAYGLNAPQADQYQYGTNTSGPGAHVYGYDGHPPYGQQPMMGPPQHGYPQYQGSPQPSVGYGPSPPPAQQWGQQAPTVQAYPSAPYQPGQQQYQQPYSGHHRSPPPQDQYQANYGDPNYIHPISGSGPTQPVVMASSGYETLTHPPHYQSKPGSSNTTAHQAGFHAPVHVQQASEIVSTEQQFNWDLQKIFQENKGVRPADPIACPLPALFDQEPILPPAYNATGVTCKYIRSNNLEVFSRPIRKSLQWALLKSDPAFNTIDFKSYLIPLDEVGQWAAERQAIAVSQGAYPSAGNTPQSFEQDVDDHRIDYEQSIEPPAGDHMSAAQSGRRFSSSDEPPHGSRSRTPSAGRSSTPNLENPGTPSLGAADDDAWAPQPGESEISQMKTPVGDSYPRFESSDPTEAILASLGVSGAPKPSLKTAESYGFPPKDQWSPESYVHEQTNDKQPREQPQDDFARRPSRQDSGYVSARGSYSSGPGIGFENANPRGSRQNYTQQQPPPPPPPPPRSRRPFDAVGGSLSDGSARDRARRHSSTHDVPVDGAHAHGNSPLSPTSAELLGLEKPAFLSEGKVERQRQAEDDIDRKMKRRQPKVADAYSRRW